MGRNDVPRRIIKMELRKKDYPPIDTNKLLNWIDNHTRTSINISSYDLTQAISSGELQQESKLKESGDLT